jgi:hypothetical protein
MTDLQRRLEERVQDANYERRIQELRTPFVWPNDPREREIIALALSLAGEAGERGGMKSALPTSSKSSAIFKPTQRC